MIVSHQLLSLIAMIAAGVLAAAVIDAIRTAGGGTKAGSAIETMAWPLLGLAAFWALFAVRSGEWRLYDLLAQLSGIFLYEAFLHRPFRFFGRLIIILFIRPVFLLIAALWRIVSFLVGIPVRLVLAILRLLMRPFQRPIRAVRRRTGKLWRGFRRKISNHPLKKRSA